MKVRHLLNLRRYRRARRMFRDPLRVHWHIARAANSPLMIDLVDGGRLSVADVRQCRAMFDWLLEQSDGPWPVGVENDLVVFTHRGGRVALRAIGADFLVFKEIFVDDVYRIGSLGGRLGTVVDIGANVGLFTLRVAPLADRVVAVEPVSGNLAMVRRNLERTGMLPKVSLHHCAVTGASGKTVRIHLSDGNHGGNSMSRELAAEWGSSGHEDVGTISLADLFARERLERCNILKCDTEGAEYEIIQKTPLEILRRIDRILMEVHFTGQEGDRQRFDGLRDHLTSSGFRLEHEPLLDRRGKPKRVIMLYADRAQTG